MDKILVTGGAGFIGASLVRSLTVQGHTVRILDNFSSGSLDHLRDVRPKPKMIEGSVVDAEAALRGARGTDAIIHLAAQAGVGPSIENPRSDFDINVTGTFNVLDAARRSGTPRVIVASSGAVLGGARGTLREDVAPSVLSPYGASKAFSEVAAQAFTNAFDVNSIAFRFSNVYGPFCSRKRSVIPIYLRAALDDQPFVVYGNGRQRRDFIHVDDICAAVIAALGSDVAGTFHLASGTTTTVNELTRVVATVAGVPRRVDRRPPRAGDGMGAEVDASSARRRLHWRPRVDLREGIERTLEWLRTNA
ncbi:MAG: NAD-dependent epimerase/dehydratase family protein [Actinomycetota bacterium]